jgi:hypothetical protein
LRRNQYETSGYVFHGKGKLLIDSIIETCRGAVGKSTERDLNEPFLMLGGAKELSDSMSPANASDISRLGYESEQAFVERGDVVCKRFFRKQSRHSRWNLNTEDSRLFAFMHDENRHDLLISKKEKLLYVADGETYVFKGDKGVLTRHGEVVVSKKGQTVHIMNNNVLVERQE